MPDGMLVLIVFVMGMIGAVAVLPYGFAMGRNQLAQVKLPRWKLVLVTLVNNAVLFAAATFIGLLAAGAIGHGAPIIEAGLRGEPILPLLAQVAPLAIVCGVAAGALIVMLEAAYFGRRLPSALREVPTGTPVWQRFAASFYGGMAEEILLRLFALSSIAWLLSRIWHTAAGMPTDGVFWTANIVAAVLFGLGHLPATARLAPLTPMLVIRALVLNGIAGIIAGYLYWHYGLETAMIAHFSADQMVLIVGPELSKYARRRTADQPKEATL